MRSSAGGGGGERSSRREKKREKRRENLFLRPPFFFSFFLFPRPLSNSLKLPHHKFYFFPFFLFNSFLFRKPSFPVSPPSFPTTTTPHSAMAPFFGSRASARGASETYGDSAPVKQQTAAIATAGRGIAARGSDSSARAFVKALQSKAEYR